MKRIIKVKARSPYKDFYVIPYKRDKEAAGIYKYLDWYFRRNKEKLKKEIADNILNFLKYGKVS